MNLEKGCRNAVETCMGVSEEDKVLIVCDEDSLSVGKALRDTIRDYTQHIRFFNLDIYGKRPLGQLPDAILETANASTATFWTASSYKGELETVRMPFFKAAINGGRHAHMVSITDEIVKRALTGDYVEIEKFTNKIHSLAVSADEVRITSEKGTDLICKVGKYKWIPSTGIIRGIGNWHNLPDGEIFTTPYAAEGTAVIDGTIGDYFDKEYSLAEVEENPVTLKITGEDPARLVDIECGNKKLKKEFEEYVDQNPCSRNLGELGIGTNLFIDGLIGNMLMDEKYPSAHIAFGDPNDAMTFAGWSCPEHVDMIIRHCDIWFDDTMVMEKGKYLIDEI